ncbi:hypothetical protein I553_2198 [Mycobacterium xenopi 4042]|uniref:Uncharacterized protein n=1 Tax=Mycobacterium xenopi 4042 TaxID=1299334 RepID=X8DNF8_MYCXE|nr:hypothetical protein I553_2198 [Mycobacterium xenopi 4042]
MSLAAASYLSTGRSLSRLSPNARAQLLRRVAALSPDAGAAIEGLKAIVLLANGADTYAPELLARAGEHDVARPDAALDVRPSVDSPSVVRADAVVVGSGAGGRWRPRLSSRRSADRRPRGRPTLDRRGVPHPAPDRPLRRPVPRAGRRSRWDARPWCCRSGARSVAPPSSTPAPAIARR